MAFVIAQPCIGVKDASCTANCPVDAIHPKPDEADYGTVDQLFIDPRSCIDCESCVANCPESAIFHPNELPSEWIGAIQKAKDYYGID